LLLAFEGQDQERDDQERTLRGATFERPGWYGHGWSLRATRWHARGEQCSAGITTSSPAERKDSLQIDIGARSGAAVVLGALMAHVCVIYVAASRDEVAA
jgi:hypothetical protein